MILGSTRARDDELLGVPVKLCAPEEMIWMKLYIMERERLTAPTSCTFFAVARRRSTGGTWSPVRS